MLRVESFGFEVSGLRACARSVGLRVWECYFYVSVFVPGLASDWDFFTFGAGAGLWGLGLRVQTGGLGIQV